MNENNEEYLNIYNQFLKKIAEGLENYIKDILKSENHIDRITARAKTPESFFKKSNSLEKNGEKKYTEPLTEIQDQIGARVIVFYKQDVNIIKEKLNKYFRYIEETEIKPESLWEFGYFGLHLIYAIPNDVIPDEYEKEIKLKFFELQIKTLFQHAWSESNHDLGYKPEKELTQEEKRLLAFSASQAWGADHVFHELLSEEINE